MTNKALPGSSSSPLEARLLAIVYIVSLVSLWSLLLLSISRFTPSIVALGALVISVAVLVAMRRTLVIGRLKWQEWIAIGIVGVGIIVRSNPATFLIGGQDPGVYASMAGYFANNGTLNVRDPLLPELKTNPKLLQYYATTSTHNVRQIKNNSWTGSWVAGVYLHNFDKNEWVFQFYALHPSWLAIGNWVFGLHGQSWILVLFSSASILIAYFITRYITGSHAPGLCVALLLALNPAHSYLATFPLSETVASFFFLASVLLLLHQRFLVFLLPLACLFLTRISGFITAPLVLASLAWIVAKRRDIRAVWAGFGVIVTYAISFYWGLAFSPNYSRDIYLSKVHINPDLLGYGWILFLAAAITWAAGCWALLRHRTIVTHLLKPLVRHRTAIGILVIAAILIPIAYRGYLLGFTQAYNSNRWFGTRWGIAGHGMKSVRHMSIYTLGLLLTAPGIILFFPGLIYTIRIAVRRAVFAPIAFLTAGFAGIFLIRQLTTPFLYYYGRYLVSELLPLAIICGVTFLHALSFRVPRVRRLVLPLYVLVTSIILFPTLKARLSITDGKEFTEAMECINQLTPGRAVILVDLQKLPLSGARFVTPLRIAYGKSTFSFRSKDVKTNPDFFRSLISFFNKNGREVYLLSIQPHWNKNMGFESIARIPLILKTVGGRAAQPKKISVTEHPIRIFSLKPSPNSLPTICEKVQGYERK